MATPYIIELRSYISLSNSKLLAVSILSPLSFSFYFSFSFSLSLLPNSLTSPLTSSTSFLILAPYSIQLTPSRSTPSFTFIPTIVSTDSYISFISLGIPVPNWTRRWCSENSRISLCRSYLKEGWERRVEMS